ncbi:MAG: fasciclin domain-containing protein [Bacteroidaceae bacterium]|nr:fasciclin domain-containing protein [Bacteroidaceae bacterium]
MAKKKFFRLIQAGLAALAIAMVLPACSDDHFDVKEGDGLDANATKTLWEQIEARRSKDLSRFATIVEKTPYFKDEAHKAYKDEAKTQPYTYKDVLNGTQILTVFAPTDEAFSEEEYQEYLTKLEGSMEDQYDVYLRLVGNHICRNRYTATGTGEEKLVMINGKKATFSRSEKTFKDLNLLVQDGEVCYNIPAVNGTLHLINQQSSFSYNLYEYIKAHGDEYSMFKKWIVDHDTIFFSESASVENGSDADGNPIYVDSVYQKTNILFRYGDYSKSGEDWVMNLKTFHGSLEEEDSVWALAAPTDQAWNAFQADSILYKYATLYINKDYEENGNSDRTIPKDGPMNADSLRELAMNMDFASMTLFNVRQQPRTEAHTGFWTAEEFVNTPMAKIFNTRIDTFTVEEKPVSDAKLLIFDNCTSPVEVSNGLLYPVNNWNFFKACRAKDVEVKVSTSSLFRREYMSSSYEYNTFNNATSALVKDSLLGSISDDYFMTFSYGTSAPTIELKLIDREMNHQVLSNQEYMIGVVMVPDFYRWSPDSIMSVSPTELAVKKNKLELRILYNEGKLNNKGKVSEKQTEKFAFEYSGERVDTIWLENTVTFPVSYKNITESYPILSLKSAASRTETTSKEGKPALYQHAFSVDRIILRAKE